MGVVNKAEGTGLGLPQSLYPQIWLSIFQEGCFTLHEIWLGGLDSNQDSQIQNLKSCQLDDLPTC